MESTTQPLHLSNESCLVDSNNTAPEVKNSQQQSRNNTTTQLQTALQLSHLQTTQLQVTYNPYQNSC